MHFGAALRGNDAKVAEEVGDEFARLALGIEVKKKDDAGRVADFFEEAEEQGRFAHSGGRNHGGKTTVAGEAELKRFQSLLVRGTEKQATRIGVNSERFFLESEVLQQHDENLQPATVLRTPACAQSPEARATRRSLDSCYLETPIY